MASEAVIEAIGGAVGSSIALASTYPLAIVSTWQALEHTRGIEVAGPELRQKYAALPSPIRELAIAVYFYLYSSLRQAVVTHRHTVEAKHLHLKAPSAAPGGSSRSEAIGVAGSLLVAGLAGCGNVLATTPVWVVATQLQALQRHPDPRQRGLSAWQVAVRLYKESGVVGFWKGVFPSLVMVANPTLQYILYEWLTARLLQLRQQGASKPVSGRPRGPVRLGTGDVFMLTALAKLGATLVTYPMLLIKSRLQAMNSSTAHEARYSGVLHAVATILRREGVAAFFKGMKIKMFQTVLAAALLMAIKEQVYLSTKSVLSAGLAMTSGAAAAPVAVTASAAVEASG
ncbi:hypothetical protein GPECTOR_6g619 [Gonium pectorale]|uniref:Uncharacterized protein n=1 Tax=Gonium pectorale TaxID=33097 RepID=A0A150GVH3_GONPE|nr:hypothetical protein GPECTOR_6g619 [Gonium pectorale]|eukprot:KXZ53702.1 hypothetical protein GPECTOR_6g619 [Gonium pectorale]